jgi:CubicO group peptidase (beta-lactamase class C family)
MTPQQHLDTGIEQIRTKYDVPALAAAVVCHNGAQRVYTAKGIRRSDKSSTLAANRVQPSDRFPLGSISKPITGILMAVLNQSAVAARQPLLRWTSRVVDVFPEFASAACRAKYGVRSAYLNVTVEQLMSQASGIFDQYGNMVGEANKRSDPPTQPEHWFFENPGGHLQEWANEDALRYRRFLWAVLCLQMSPLFPAGQGKGYGAAPTICAAMAERVTGKSFKDLMNERFFWPAGMTQSTFLRHSTSSAPDGPFQHTLEGAPYEKPSQLQVDYNANAPVGTAAMSPRDMALFIEQNLPASPGTAARILTPAELTSTGERITMPDVTRAGWGWANSPRQLWHGGSTGKMEAGIRIFPQLGYGVCASATISGQTVNGDQNQGNAAVGEALAYMDGMAHNWAILFPAAARSGS